MPDTPLAKKLFIKPGMRLLILNAPEGYRSLLGELHAEPESTPGQAGTFDWVQMFAKNLTELEQASPAAQTAVKPGGTLWISFPKKTSKLASDIGRDSAWNLMGEKGWQGTTNIAIDETWSAMRFKLLQ
ncbi:MAG: hypothetical protein JWO42_2567 [Chloroflexi bacterium]|nr:hypothetical protein [Chloroflexota bacterium]